MSETAPPAPATSAPPEKPAAVGKKAKKPAKAAATAKKSVGPSVSELLVQAVSSSKERSGVSLAALKKALAAAGYDVEKNNSRIKLGLKSLVSKGTLVQTKGTGASGSFKLNKKAASGEAKANPPKVAKAKVTGASKKPKKVTAATKKAVKTPKKAKKPAVAKKPSKSPKKPKKVAKSPAKAKAVKPKAAKAKVTKPKTAAKPKKAAPKKK
ncbi:histone H1.1 [Mustela nigripes]|uniref:Histone H1.1 isoform X1 n=1 Tax=Mustela putorius furo TaxID=9669 RepID=A0A8U0S8A0_MUSPF|nr:histone H1.1 isoform X1 [Mustela putorius furo]XP_044938165.1 histone H1.1 isoform X1 [Mustela putorius furo]XP_044938166.1 histone H1.1 isoform X1 [Mustela putorius furo]XP_059255575.1 histone H1.1 [Mustela nigripes]XP_059255576.1 histone H1.1 [Mustela nigripes]